MRRGLAILVFGLGITLAAVGIVTIRIDHATLPTTLGPWLLHLLPYFFVGLSSWLIFSKRGRRLVAADVSRQAYPSAARSISGRTIVSIGRVLIGALMIAMGYLLVSLIFSLYASGPETTAWLARRMFDVYGMIMTIATPISAWLLLTKWPMELGGSDEV